MRIVNWNIEWMNNWFVGQGANAFRNDNPGRGITDVADLCQRVAGVIVSLDPDVLLVEEGPSDWDEMALFVRQCLGDDADTRALADEWEADLDGDEIVMLKLGN